MPKTTDRAQRIATAADFRAAYERAQQTTEWTAPSGLTVRVRRPDLETQAVLDLLPARCQQAVMQSLELTLNADRTVKSQIADVLSGEATAIETIRALGLELPELLQMASDTTDAYVLAGWAEPRVVATGAAITDPEQEIPLEWIARPDREAFRDWCQRGEVAEASGPTTFPDQQAGDVEPVSDGEDVRATA